MKSTEELEKIIHKQEQQLEWYSAKLRELSGMYYKKSSVRSGQNTLPFGTSLKNALKHHGVVGCLLKVLNPIKLYYFIIKHLK